VILFFLWSEKVKWENFFKKVLDFFEKGGKVEGNMKNHLRERR